MSVVRGVKTVLRARPTADGAGVRLLRVFGRESASGVSNEWRPPFDPFLMMDEFGSTNPKDYMAGFPWHPHRGIETVTYLLSGEVEHEDSLGNKGVLKPGDVQWMTAGSGIIHQEMPKFGGDSGTIRGLQLWLNLPASHRMMEPRYQDITAARIPTFSPEKDVQVRVIAGEINCISGPVKDVIAQPFYLDISLGANTSYAKSTPLQHTVIAYILEGSGWFGSKSSKTLLTRGQLVHFEQGDSVHVTAAERGMRYVLIGGKPISEPVTWAGPVVMSTEEEVERAFEEYRNGTFVKHRAAF